eukprot:6367699-Ditylum_brightwellii.AAC.1
MTVEILISLMSVGRSNAICSDSFDGACIVLIYCRWLSYGIAYRLTEVADVTDLDDTFVESN